VAKHHDRTNWTGRGGCAQTFNSNSFPADYVGNADSAFYNRVATIYTTLFKIQKHYILPTHCSYLFRKTLRKGAIIGSCL